MMLLVLFAVIAWISWQCGREYHRSEVRAARMEGFEIAHDAMQQGIEAAWQAHFDCCSKCTAGMGAELIEREDWEEAER
jgi:hypothetical protein